MFTTIPYASRLHSVRADLDNHLLSLMNSLVEQRDAAFALPDVRLYGKNVSSPRFYRGLGDGVGRSAP